MIAVLLVSVEEQPAYLLQPHDRKHKVPKVTHRMNVLGMSHLEIELYAHLAFEGYSKFLVGIQLLDSFKMCTLVQALPVVF